MMTYAQPPETFAQMIAPFSDEVQATAQSLRQTIQAVLPQLEEKIYGGSKVANALYHFADPNQVVCGIQANEKVCKLFLHFFDQAKDMGFRIEGSGKHARHIKFAAAGDVELNALQPLLEKVWQASGYANKQR